MSTTGSSVVAIDGPAGAGKSTVSRRVADALGLPLVDTGAMYRAVALLARERDVDWSDAPRLGELASGLAFRFGGDAHDKVWVNERDVSSAIRSSEMSHGASIVSAYPEVREALRDAQRSFAAQGGAVLEGRDIGTVVFPDAQVKIYLDATPQERARRRYEELKAAGESTTLEAILADVQARDERDRKREHAPLKVAQDAVVVDATTLSIDDVVLRIVEIARQSLGSPKP